jgi:ferric-dicitrate binding protein FerR (iron transport regulator)
MRFECERWVGLSDLEAIDEPLAQEDREFLRTHAVSCSDCRQEAGVWRSLQSPAPGAAPDAGEIDAILSAARRVPSGTFTRRRAPVVAGAATLLACAAAFAVWFGIREPERAAPADTVSATPNPAQKAIARGEPTPDVRSASKRDAEPSCSEVVTGVTVCLAEDSKIASKSLDGANRTIELVRGRAVVSLVPQPPGTTFSVTTSVGRVTAVGTIFSVSVGDDGASVVRVSDGRVLVRANSARETRSVRAGEVLQIGDAQPRALAASDRESDLALLPVSARAHGETAANGSGTPVAPSTVRSDGLPQEQLLEQARSLRGRGEFRKAADLYRRINEQNPRSASGSAALISLGELLLSSLNDPKGALNAFNAYLAGGGPLAREALFGKARALRALNQRTEERRSIQQFIASYPDSPQSRVLQRRLTELE